MDADALAEGGFLKRVNQSSPSPSPGPSPGPSPNPNPNPNLHPNPTQVNQSDLLRMAGLGSGDKAERAPREEDESLRKQNCYSLAIELLKASLIRTLYPYPDPDPDSDPDPTLAPTLTPTLRRARSRGYSCHAYHAGSTDSGYTDPFLQASAQQSDDGRPTRVFRQGEFLPFVAVSRTGGAAGLKQFENVAAPSDAVQRGTPVNLKLLYSNRVLPLVSVSIAIVSRAAPLLQPDAARALTR